jgi:hypothetical protein
LRASTTGGIPGTVVTAGTVAGSAGAALAGALAWACTEGAGKASAHSSTAAANAKAVRLDTLVTVDWGLIVI